MHSIAICCFIVNSPITHPIKKVRSVVKRDFGYFLLISVDQIHSDSVKKNGSFFMIFFIQIKSRH